jgi:hypothetical protein
VRCLPEQQRIIVEIILVLDYIEGQDQVLAYYVNELRARAYNLSASFTDQCLLPSS